MKISIFIIYSCALWSAKRTYSSVIHSHRHSSWEVDQVSEILTPQEIRELQYWDEKYFHRSKRSGEYGGGSSGSGSSDLIGAIAKAVANGIKKKVKAVANGSAGALAGASAGFSKGSSADDSPKYHTTGYGEHPTGYDHVDSGTEHKYDPWELKSSIFNTLLQALKAIKGGVLAIKGQLIKGSGFIVSGAGKVIAASGDKVTDLGKNVISKAVLVKPDKHPAYGPPTAYGPPSAPPSSYGAPPPSYSGPSSYASSYTDHHSHNDVKLPLPPGSQAGILILKKIQTGHHKEAASSNALPNFKPLSPASPSYGTYINKILSASVKPSSYGSTGNSPSYDFPIAPLHYENPRNNYQISTEPIIAAPTASDYTLPITNQGLTAPQSDLNLPTAPASTSFGGDLKPPPTSYGSPFEQQSHQESFSNDHLSAEGSQKNIQSVKPEKLTKGEVLEKLEATKPTKSISNEILKGPLSSEFLDNTKSSEIKTSASSNYLKNALYPESVEFMEVAHTNDFLRPPASVRGPKFSSMKIPNSFKTTKYPRLEDYPGYLENISDEEIFKKIPSHSKTRTKPAPPYYMRSHKPSSSNLRNRRPSLDVVRSVSFEITPDGPKRLT